MRLVSSVVNRGFPFSIIQMAVATFPVSFPGVILMIFSSQVYFPSPLVYHIYNLCQGVILFIFNERQSIDVRREFFFFTDRVILHGLSHFFFFASNWVIFPARVIKD